MKPKKRLQLVLIATVFVVAGCQRRGDLSGTIQFQDKTIEVGTITVVGADGVPHTHPLDNGKYAFKDLPMGRLKIAVGSPDPGTIKFIPRLKSDAVPTQADRSRWFAIPEKYADLQKSGLTFDLQSGENKFDIKLE